MDFNLIQVFTWFKDGFVNITYSLSLPYQANGFSSLTNVSAFLWPATLLMSYVGSSDKFRAIVCGLAIRPLMLPRYPHCELPRPPISLLSTEETKSAPGNIFFQSIKSRISMWHHIILCTDGIFIDIFLGVLFPTIQKKVNVL